jgi:hypothetical protein
MPDTAAVPDAGAIDTAAVPDAAAAPLARRDSVAGEAPVVGQPTSQPTSEPTSDLTSQPTVKPSYTNDSDLFSGRRRLRSVWVRR